MYRLDPTSILLRSDSHRAHVYLPSTHVYRETVPIPRHSKNHVVVITPYDRTKAYQHKHILDCSKCSCAVRILSSLREFLSLEIAEAVAGPYQLRIPTFSYITCDDIISSCIANGGMDTVSFGTEITVDRTFCKLRFPEETKCIRSCYSLLKGLPPGIHLITDDGFWFKIETYVS
jgi:hypothetical protein